MLKCKEELIDILIEEGKELLELYDHSKGMGGGGGNFFYIPHNFIITIKNKNLWNKIL